MITSPNKPHKIENPGKNFDEVYDKRKEIVEEHAFCSKGIKTGIDFAKVASTHSTVFAYLIFDKC